jgi:hypothetical protein
MATFPCWPGAPARRRSPRIVQSAWIIVFPPRMMFCEPRMLDLRLTLLPVSVSMYSPLTCLGGIVRAAGLDWSGLVMELGEAEVVYIAQRWGTRWVGRALFSVLPCMETRRKRHPLSFFSRRCSTYIQAMFFAIANRYISIGPLHVTSFKRNTIYAIMHPNLSTVRLDLHEPALTST